MKGQLLHVFSAGLLSLIPSLPQSLGGFELRSQKLGTAYHWREEKAVELPGQGLPSRPYPDPIPVIVLADTAHCAQGLQVVVGLSGAEAVQRLAAPWVPIGGSEIDSHLGAGREGACCSHENQRPEVTLGKPIGSLIVE